MLNMSASKAGLIFVTFEAASMRRACRLGMCETLSSGLTFSI
jgi:hypothetical protein